jgi:hypothetical protein
MGSDKALLVASGCVWNPGFRRDFVSAAIRALSPLQIRWSCSGKQRTDLAPACIAAGVLMRNPRPSWASSVPCAWTARSFEDGTSAAAITLVDRPPATADTLQTLRAAFESDRSEIWAVVPEVRWPAWTSVPGGREMIEAFLKAPATATARDVEHQHRTTYRMSG